MSFLPRPAKTAVIAALLAGCAATQSALSQDAIFTADAVAAAAWSPTVTLTIDGDVVHYQSNGLPDHALPDRFVVPNDGNTPPFGGGDATDFSIVNTVDLLVADPIDVTITLLPVFDDTPTDTELGMIGVALSGARIFNDYEQPGRGIAALDDNLTIDGASFVDACNAHPLQDGTSYHYHGVPTCITAVLDTPGAHSVIIGLLLDGFPIYGPQGAGGQFMTNADLDNCSGHTEPTPEFPGGIYHYHLTVDDAPYSIDCYHGSVEGVAFEGGGGPGGPGNGGPGGGPDFAAAAAELGIDETALRDALGGPPPDFDAAAATLGVSVDALRAVLPPPPN